MTTTPDTLAKLAADFNRYFTSANSADVGTRVSVPTAEWRALHAALTAQALPAAELHSLDLDPLGIRARAASAITGALAFGAQGVNPPPEGHWLAPFWEMAQAERAQQAAQATAGWLLVPVEPTETMLEAALHASMQHLIDCINDPAKVKDLGSEENCKKTHAARYRSMIAAALPQPQPQSAQSKGDA